MDLRSIPNEELHAEYTHRMKTASETYDKFEKSAGWRSPYFSQTVAYRGTILAFLCVLAFDLGRIFTAPAGMGIREYGGLSGYVLLAGILAMVATMIFFKFSIKKFKQKFKAAYPHDAYWIDATRKYR